MYNVTLATCRNLKTGYGARAIALLLLLMVRKYEAGIASSDMMPIRNFMKILQFLSKIFRDDGRT
jgi:hypothetical protein